MKNRLAIGVLLLVLALMQPASAQTSTARLVWDQDLTGVQTLADVQAFAWTLKIDAGPVQTVTATCVAGTPIVCSTPLGPFASTGQHTLVLTGINGFGSASATLSGAPPQAARNVRVVITVTVP